MKQEEMKTAEVVSDISAFGVQVDEPMHREPSVKGLKMKPPLPADARGMGQFIG